jgi:glycosyltransferase involved in cell wall biosynthesis
VIVHGIWLYPSVGVWLALRDTKTPYFVYSHGMLDPVFRTLFPLKHIAKSVLWKIAEHRVVRDARAIFFTCEEEQRLAHESFKPFRAHEAIVPYCVGAPAGDAKSQREIFYSRWPDLKSKRIVLFLSRIHPKKGCDALIEAFARVAPKDPSLHLVVAGPDPVKWQLQLEDQSRRLGVANRITWTGMLAGDLKWGAFHAAEVFVLPSHQENFGIAVVEALACGLPVLISNRINIWREIEADGAGLSAGPGADETAALLEKWLVLDLARKQAMRDNAERCFAARFKSDRAAENLLKTLHDHGVADR